MTSVKRMEKSIKRGGKSFINRIFTPAEQAYCESKRMKFEHYAARFAAKEAACKAFSLSSEKMPALLEIEVRRKATGEPVLHLTPSARKKAKIAKSDKIFLSLSHEREFAVAVVLIVKGGKA